MNRHTTPVKVFSGTLMQAGMVKSLLENVEVEAFLKNEIIGTINPWHAAPGGAGAVKVFVSEEDLELAKQIVAEYESNLNR